MQDITASLLVGWREWVALPELGIKRIKAKIDTGARTSTLHAFQIRTFLQQGQEKIEFLIHPVQASKKKVICCVSNIIDQRWVTDSGGHGELRYVIQTLLQLGATTWPIELTLTNRDDMRFRMLLGRTAMQGKLVVDPGASYLLPKQSY